MSERIRILTVLGARPQFVKAAAVSRAFAEVDGLREKIVDTGQHYDDNMARIFFEELKIPPPAYSLGIGSGAHGAQTGRMLQAVEEVLLQEKPDWVMVYGDTNSTLAGALAAAKLHIPVAHVEAGLRSFDRRMPEEINRVMADHLSELLFVPTQAAIDNLASEGITGDKVQMVGDVMYDTALYYGEQAGAGILERLGLQPGGYVLATVHRAENTDDPARLSAIFEGFAQVARQRPVVLPLHPRTRAALERQGKLALTEAPNFKVIEPVGYLDMLALERHASLIATDSGGVQKEAYFYGVPCVTLRDSTEWVELVETGWNRLVTPDSAESIAAALTAELTAPASGDKLYGDGEASRKIARLLLDKAPANERQRQKADA